MTKWTPTLVRQMVRVRPGLIDFLCRTNKGLLQNLEILPAKSFYLIKLTVFQKERKAKIANHKSNEQAIRM